MVESKINVFIDGDKSNFVSKLSINKFKQKVKQPDFQLDDLNNISSRILYVNLHIVEVRLIFG